MTSQPGLFFSYSRSDGEFALKLATDLRERGIDLWIDQLDIDAGDRWDEAIQKALESRSTLLVILSPESVGSHNVMDEVSFALEERKRIVPALYKPCKVPLRLGRLQRIDFTKGYERGLAELIDDLRDGTSSTGVDSEAAMPRAKDGGPRKPLFSKKTLASVGAIVLAVGGFFAYQWWPEPTDGSAKSEIPAPAPNREWATLTPAERLRLMNVPLVSRQQTSTNSGIAVRLSVYAPEDTKMRLEVFRGSDKVDEIIGSVTKDHPISYIEGLKRVDNVADILRLPGDTRIMGQEHQRGWGCPSRYLRAGKSCRGL